MGDDGEQQELFEKSGTWGGGVYWKKKLVLVSTKAEHTCADDAAIPLITVWPMETPPCLHQKMQENIHNGTLAPFR